MPAELALAAMSLAQRAGQLVMVGSPAGSTSRSARTAISKYHVGNLMLTGRSSRGVAGTAAITRALQRRATTAATAGVRLFVATDQEGGAVQVLSGPGFSPHPDRDDPGWVVPRSCSPAGPRSGDGSCDGAGVNVDPRPGRGHRARVTWGPPTRRSALTTASSASTPAAVSSAAASPTTQGMRAARIAVAPKHFPGLGRVRANTDTTSRSSGTR